MLAEMPATLRSTGENGAREYELLAPLAPGLDPARGEIYLGRRTLPPDLAASVIIKHAPLAHERYERIRERLLDEALESASTIHPNMSSVADVIENDHGLYLVLEHVDGTDLETVSKRLLERKQVLSFELIAFITAEVLKALQQLHTARDANGKQLLLVLRDVTPSNVLISSTGRVKLANRSLAEALEKKRRRSAAQLFAYFAPECIAGEPFSIASDIYGVGVMLWELLVGRRCFGGETKEQVLTAILKRGVPVQDLQLVKTPSRLVGIIEKATAFVPERRYSSATDMARALEGFLHESAQSNDLTPLLAHFLTNAKLLPSSSESGPSAAANAMVRLLPATATPAHEMEAVHDSDIEALLAAHADLIDDLIEEHGVHDTDDMAPMAIEPDYKKTEDLPFASTPPGGTATSSTSLSDRDRRAIAVRTVRDTPRNPVPPAAFSEQPIVAPEKPVDVKSRTLVWLLALAIAILAVIIIFIERQEYRLDEMDRASDNQGAGLRDRYAPKTN